MHAEKKVWKCAQDRGYINCTVHQLYQLVREYDLGDNRSSKAEERDGIEAEGGRVDLCWVHHYSSSSQRETLV